MSHSSYWRTQGYIYADTMKIDGVLKAWNKVQPVYCFAEYTTLQCQVSRYKMNCLLPFPASHFRLSDRRHLSDSMYRYMGCR